MVALDAPIQRINVHIREGSILPLQEPNTTTYASRKNGFELRAAINSRTGKAEGSLFWDDGDSLGMESYLQIVVVSAVFIAFA